MKGDELGFARRRAALSGLAFAAALWNLAASAAGLRLNVRDFGAVGDGVHDDTPALQKALDRQQEFARENAMKGAWHHRGFAAPEIFLPAGRYRITRSLVGGCVTRLTGEKGCVIDGGEWMPGPILYIDLAFNCRVDGVVFRGGEHHVAFWTANWNAASIVLENCLFVGAMKEAVFTESYRNRPEAKDYAEEFSKDFKEVPAGPYAVIREADGNVTIRRTQYRNRLANSTRFTLRHCGFKDCGAAYRGATDAQFLSDVRFVSTREQRLPVFSVNTEFELSDCAITANLPKGYPYAWVETGNANVHLVNVTASSTSAHGAPLLATCEQNVAENPWRYCYRQATLERCRAAVAGAPKAALVVCRRWPMVALVVKECSELNGAKIPAAAFGRIPKGIDEIRACGQICDEDHLPAKDVFRWRFDRNGDEIDTSVPDFLRSGVEAPLPPAAYSGFPALGVPLWLGDDEAPTAILDGSKFGLGLVRLQSDETESFEALLAAAAREARPCVLLPGRTISVGKTFALPRQIAFRAAGAAIIRQTNPSNDFFHVKGDGLAVAFRGIGFEGGRSVLVAEGSGRVALRDGMTNSGGGIAASAKGGALDVALLDMTMVGPRFLDNHGAKVSFRDCWLQFRARPWSANSCVNVGGTVVFEHICGVPVTSSNNISRDRIAGLPAGVDLAWIRNEGGVIRSSDFRFGGEFGGLTAVDNYGAGMVLIERQVGAFYNFGSTMSFFRNADRSAKITIDHVKYCADNIKRVKLGRGVRPGSLHVGGNRYESVGFDFGE